MERGALRLPLSLTWLALAVVVASALPAFLLRATGVMDDSVFWVAAKSLAGGKVLYRDVFFTQPPLFIFVPEALWLISTNIFFHRAFLYAVWLFNGYLFYLTIDRLDRPLRLLATSLFLVAAFILQSYALHTEIFVLTAFLLALLAIHRRFFAADLTLGLTASAAFFIKPIGPLVFIPCLYLVLVAQRDRWRRLVLILGGAAVPMVVIGAYLVAHGTFADFWQQVVLDNGNLGLSLGADWQGYFQLLIAPLLIPLFIGLIVADRRPDQLEWWLTAGLFIGLLVIELARGARHYGLFNLCVLAWMAVRAQDGIRWRDRGRTTALGLIVALAAVFQVVAVREILARGSIMSELSASNFVHALPGGSLQVFANNPPRIYMLLNNLVPAYAYLFVYDTNRNVVIWDNYTTMIEQSPPDYIAVESDFKATEYGQLRSTELVDAAAVRTWIEQTGEYQELQVGHSLGLTVYEHSIALRRE